MNMKNKILSLLAILGIFISACEKDYSVDYYDLGTEFFLSGSKVSTLDAQIQVSVNNLPKNLSSLTVYKATSLENLGTVSIADGKGTFLADKTSLGLDLVGNSVSLIFEGQFDGKSITRSITVKHVSPFSIKLPNLIANKDISKLFLNISPIFNTITNVDVQTKVGSNGTFTSYSGVNAKDSIIFDNSNYSTGDTVIFKIVAATSTLEDEFLDTLIVDAWTFDANKSFSLAYGSTKSYDLIKLRSMDITETSTGDSSDLHITAKYDLTLGLVLGFSAENNAQFVSTTKVFYKEGDVNNSMSVDFSVPVLSYDNVAVDDAFVFRTKRGTDNYSYGLLIVKALNKPQGVKEDSSIDFEVKYLTE